MGVTELVHLTDEIGEWEDWGGFGLDIGDISEVEVQPDGTLTYRGRRVLVYIRDQPIDRRTWGPKPGYRYHVADCQKLQEMRANQRYGRYVVTTRADGRFIVNLFRRGGSEIVKRDFEREMNVCKFCLTDLNWHGYVGLHGRDREACWESFDPEVFLEEYGSRVRIFPQHTPETAPLNQYPTNWSEVSRATREGAGWTCEECGEDLSDPEAQQWLHAHHIDGNKANNARSNLRALCIECHAAQYNHEWLRLSPDYSRYEQWKASRESARRLWGE